MLERALTTACCRDIVRFLTVELGWTVARIARTIGAPSDCLNRIQSGKQSFQLSDVEALARASRRETHMLIFESIRRNEALPQDQGLYDLALKEIKRHQEFRRTLARKPARKRRTPTKAA
jgi:hypothetical protein